MSMTRLEVEERARQIWGDQVESVEKSFYGSGQWYVSLGKLRILHLLDGNGHAICHQECADAEVQVAR